MKPRNGKGFIIETQKTAPSVSLKEKAALLRRGNELFNKGELETARRIFITLKYSDGLIRLGDHYLKQQNFTEAMKMYHAAPDKHKLEELSQRFAFVIRKWLKDEVKDVIRR